MSDSLVTDGSPARPRGLIAFVANANIPSLQLSFLTPLGLAPGDGLCELLTEQEMNAACKAGAKGPAGTAWFRQRLGSMAMPDVIVFCRYSGPHPSAVVDWARERGIPTIFHLDDDLLNVPIELGAAKHAMHNHPDRLATVRYLLDNASLVYCSTSPLRYRLFGKAPSDRAVAGDVYCVQPVRAEPPLADEPQVIGYMGFDHAHDFKLALPALVRLLDARPDLPFEMFGSIPIPEELKRFGDRIRVVEPIRDYAAFTDKLASLRWTIGICPLAKTPFNEVKADTKWVEYTASGFAVIASRGTVYDSCCADGCGILADGEDEWMAAFEHLLDAPEAREAQVRRAQEKLRAEYSPERLRAQIEEVFAKAKSLAAAEQEGKTTRFSLRSVTKSFERGAEVPPAAQVMICLDGRRGDRVFGWAWDPAEAVDPRTEHRPLELWCGTTRIGMVPRRLPRPDVDDYVGDPVGAKGFEIPTGGLVSLWHLLRGKPGFTPTLRLGTGIASLVETDPAFREIASIRTLGNVTDPAIWGVVDLWWASPRLLKLRTQPRAGRSPPPIGLRVLQVTTSSDGSARLDLVDEQPLPSRADGDVILVGAQNGLMPIVLVGLGEDGSIAFVDLVPFPSLLRGGLHESELAALGKAGGTLEDFCQICDSYLAEQSGWSGEAPLHVLGEIAYDLRKATGAERIFDPSVRHWLGELFGVPVLDLGGDERRAADLGDGAFVDFAQAVFAERRPAAPRAGLSRLVLSGDAIPTIATLVSRRSSPKGAVAIVADDSFPNRRWLVSTPGEPTSLEGLDGLPRLEMLDGRATLPTGSDDRLAPTAVLFCDLSPRSDLRLLFPAPKDQDTVIAGAPTAEGVVSILVILPSSEVDVRPLLASLATQRVAANCELLVAAAASTGAAIAALGEELELAFPGRSRAIAVDTARRTSEILNRLAGEARGKTLIVLDARTILHDERTIETLSFLATVPGAATVGCMVLGRDQNTVATVRSCGWFPGRIDFGRAPHVALEQLDCHVVLADATYPVAANSSFCWAVSADAWQEVGGLSSELLPNASAEIDLAIRLAETGRTNLCTTRLSVLLDGSGAVAPTNDLGIPAHLNLWRLLPALRSSTHLRSF